jgi:hypothetical protein
MLTARKRTRLPLVGVALLAAGLTLAGCYEEETGPEYVPASLREITRGEVLSMNYKYELANPNLIVLHDHLGLARDGNLIEFLAGGSLEAKLEAYRDGDFGLGVRRAFSPFVHLRVERVTTDRDTVLVPDRENYDFPILVNPAGFDTSGFEPFDLASLIYDRKRELEKYVGMKMAVEGTIRYANLDGEFYYVLQGLGNPEALVRLDEEYPGMILILKALLQENIQFKGGITFLEVANWGALRKPFKISGPATIEYVEFGGRIVTTPRASRGEETPTAD